MQKIVIVGSINVDISAQVARRPQPGETVMAMSAARSGGGKGANQAVAAARAAQAHTTFVGTVGNDADGTFLKCQMSIDGVRAVIETTEKAPTGMALITVDALGENSIIVVPGANQLVGVSRAAEQAIATADVVLSQLEIPTATVLEAARKKRTGALFMLNAAPVVPVPEELWALVDVLIVNEHEATEIAAADPGKTDECVEALLDLVPAVVITLGGEGCLYASRTSKQIRLPAPRVKATDTTAAGDTFCGVFAAEIAKGQDPEQAMQLACAAAAITVQRVGAQISIPTRNDSQAVREEFYGTS